MCDEGCVFTEDKFQSSEIPDHLTGKKLFNEICHNSRYHGYHGAVMFYLYLCMWPKHSKGKYSANDDLRLQYGPSA